MKVATRRVAHVLVLVAWAAFFGWLWATGETTRYLGPRTYWVVPFGALLLGAAAVSHLVARRAQGRDELSLRDALGLLVLLIPVLAVAAVPNPDLGALAASRKAATGGVAPVGPAVAPAAGPRGELSFIDIHFAEESERYAAAAGINEGLRVKLTGFVSAAPRTPGAPFELSRFYVSCCAADALPYGVAVDPGDAADYREDEWLEVSGSLAKQGRRYVVVADDVTRVPAPDDPYLY